MSLGLVDGINETIITLGLGIAAGCREYNSSKSYNTGIKCTCISTHKVPEIHKLLNEINWCVCAFGSLAHYNSDMSYSM